MATKSKNADKDPNAHAKQNARGWLENIRELLAAYDAADEADDDTARDKAQQAIDEAPLSIQVRNGWRSLGETGDDGPEEYEILLSTGGPALRIVGGLDKYATPSSASLEWQDWGTPWTEMETTHEEDKEVLRFASFFCFEDA